MYEITRDSDSALVFLHHVEKLIYFQDIFFKLIFTQIFSSQACRKIYIGIFLLLHSILINLLKIRKFYKYI